MLGEWFGTLTGGPSAGPLLLSLDRRPGGFSGSAALFPANSTLPNGLYSVVLFVKNERLEGHADLRFVFLKEAFSIVGPGQVAERLPGLTIDWSRLNLTGEVRDDEATIATTVPDATVLTAKVQRRPIPEKTQIAVEVISWSQFREDLLNNPAEVGNYVFRGQARPWPLRTAFHRAGRYDINRFASEDVHRLRNAVAAATDSAFDTTNPEALAALLGIAQHHGFPTPLMDWTESPFVAAYFAFKDAYAEPKFEPTVFMLNRELWRQSQRQISNIYDPNPGLGFFVPLPVKNSRLVPQQSVLVLCNVSNAESLMLHHEGCLRAVRIDADATTVMKDLRLMGIGAAAMFPGLDGACRDAFELSIERVADVPPSAGDAYKKASEGGHSSA